MQPWIIFGDPSLEDMSIMYPLTAAELKNCQGVGEGKARKYGGEFLELICKYVEENDIERPDDFVVKTIPSKSTKKISIIQGIDRQMDLEDIAEAQGMDMDELLSNIESIAESGMKLNLNYYIDRNIDQDDVEEIFSYLREEATSDSLEDALNDLSGDFDEMDIRIVRIKFIAEVAN